MNPGGTDIAKITRKRSKPDKHEHENRKSAQEPEVSSKRESYGTLGSIRIYYVTSSKVDRNNADDIPLYGFVCDDSINLKAKHGPKRIMMNSKGFFFFKFDSRAGLEAVLEGGPWLIRKSLIILKKWSMDTRCSRRIWTRIPYGRSSFARFLIEVNSEADLVDVVTVGIPSLFDDNFTKETTHVEYEWRPSRCDTCKIFGHVLDLML
ncbi:zinc knuckle CX2CX4HX4C containing protein [Tanacetum coccineum]